MNRQIAHLVRLVAIPSLLVLGTMSAPTVAAGDPCFHGYVIPPATTGSGTDIKLMPCSFEPTVTTVAVGTEVTFFNGPEYTHLITGANQAWGSRDVEIQPDSTVSYTFDEPGIYPYACALHVGMAGAIVVGDPDEALAAGTTGEAETNATEPAPVGEVTEPASTTSSWLPLVAAGIGAGLVAGAAAVWLAVRRRTSAERPLLHAD